MHTLRVYKWSVSLLKLVNKVIWNFVWSGCIVTRKLVTVALKDCCVSIHFGGLGIENLIIFNQALLSKITWNVMLDASFDYLKFNRGYYLHSSIWPAIRSNSNLIYRQCRWIVGSDSKVLF